jgi:hypothetical protein
LQNLLSKFLLAFVNISVELVSVLADREFLVVVDRDIDFLATYRLVLGVVKLRNVRMSQCLLRSESLVRVELKETLQQIQRVVRGRREHVPQALRLSGRERLQHGLSQRAVNRVDVVLAGTADQLHHSVELVEGGGAGEDGLAQQELRKDAAQAPHVDALSVFVRTKQDFRGAVPSSCYIIS